MRTLKAVIVKGLMTYKIPFFSKGRMVKTCYKFSAATCCVNVRIAVCFTVQSTRYNYAYISFMMNN